MADRCHTEVAWEEVSKEGEVSKGHCQLVLIWAALALFSIAFWWNSGWRIRGFQAKWAQNWSWSTRLCDLGQVQFPVYKVAMVISTLQNTFAKQFAQFLKCHRSSISQCVKFSNVTMIVVMTIMDRVPSPIVLDWNHGVSGASVPRLHCSDVSAETPFSVDCQTGMLILLIFYQGLWFRMAGLQAHSG